MWNFPKAEVIKEYKWIPLDGKITGNVVIEGDVLIKGNVEVTGNLTATGYITARGSDSENKLRIYEGEMFNFRASWYKKIKEERVFSPTPC